MALAFATVRTNAENDLASLVEDISEASNLLKVKQKIRTAAYITYMLDALDAAESDYMTEAQKTNIYECLNKLNWEIKEYD